MTDLELMKRAAKAAGMVVHRGSGWQSDKLFMPTVGDGTVTGVQWDPLDDDGDALRLAVKCNISIIRLDDGKADAVWNDAQNSLHIESSTDDYAATRRAIVRAAAEIGRGMK